MTLHAGLEISHLGLEGGYLRLPGRELGLEPTQLRLEGVHESAHRHWGLFPLGAANAVRRCGHVQHSGSIEGRRRAVKDPVDTSS